jgi:hypothetical protein
MANERSSCAAKVFPPDTTIETWAPAKNLDLCIPSRYHNQILDIIFKWPGDDAEKRKHVAITVWQISNDLTTTATLYVILAAVSLLLGALGGWALRG